MSKKKQNKIQENKTKQNSPLHQLWASSWAPTKDERGWVVHWFPTQFLISHKLNDQNLQMSNFCRKTFRQYLSHRFPTLSGVKQFWRKLLENLHLERFCKLFVNASAGCYRWWQLDSRRNRLFRWREMTKNRRWLRNGRGARRLAKRSRCEVGKGREMWDGRGGGGERWKSRGPGRLQKSRTKGGLHPRDLRSCWWSWFHSYTNTITNSKTNTEKP